MIHHIHKMPTMMTSITWDQNLEKKDLRISIPVKEIQDQVVCLVENPLACNDISTVSTISIVFCADKGSEMRTG